MAGIYLHIPFCRQACHYCNFHFSTTTDRAAAMMQAIRHEAVLNRDYLTEKVETIYFGGGTPSLLPPDEINATIEALRGLFDADINAEITLEANPDDIDAERLASWRDAGITRLSIGIQSFVEKDLVWMNRAHNVKQAITAVELAHQYGFDNITIDLIYGTPHLNDEQWKQNIEKALHLKVPHLSCYALTVEPKTALANMIATHRSEDVDTDKQARHFLILTEVMAANGFEHYEISNFARPGFRSRHNSSYWQGKPYLGLGPSAHSFNGGSRQWNIANNSLYLASLQKDVVPFELEVLTEFQQLNEYIMTAIRTTEGISVSTITARFGEKRAGELLEAAEVHIHRGHVIKNGDVLQLTQEGKFLADGIAADLFAG